MQKKYFLLTAVVWIICVYHIGLGLILNLPIKQLNWAATNILGASKMPDTSMMFLVRMMGAYMVVFGIGMGAVLKNPVKNRAVLSLGIVLAALRLIQRILYPGSLESALGLAPEKHMAAVILLVLLSVMLIFFRVELHKDMKIAE